MMELISGQFLLWDCARVHHEKWNNAIFKEMTYSWEKALESGPLGLVHSEGVLQCLTLKILQLQISTSYPCNGPMSNATGDNDQQCLANECIPKHSSIKRLLDKYCHSVYFFLSRLHKNSLFHRLLCVVFLWRFLIISFSSCQLTLAVGPSEV